MLYCCTHMATVGVKGLKQEEFRSLTVVTGGSPHSSLQGYTVLTVLNVVEEEWRLFSWFTQPVILTVHSTVQLGERKWML